MIKVTIVDDQKIFREGVKFILSNEADFEVISEYMNGQVFLNNLDKIDPDVVLMDISMPEMDGIEATYKAIEKKPRIKILALSMFGDEYYYYKMIHAGAKGFIIKEAKSNELKEAIIKVAGGENYFSEKLLRKIVFHFGSIDHLPVEQVKKFTNEEIELTKLICQGLSDFEISNSLRIEVNEVGKQKNKLLTKTRSKDTANLVMYAIKNNIIEI